MAGQPTLQGARDPFVNWYYRTDVLSAHFPVVGGSEIILCDEQIFAFTEAQQLYVCQHTLDFKGQFEKFSIKTNGGSLATAAVYALWLSGVETTQVVVVEPELSAKVESDSDAVSFAEGATVVGKVVADSIGESVEAGFVQCFVQMTPNSGERSVFRTGGAGNFYGGDRIGNGFGTIPLSGTNNHYDSKISQKIEIDYQDSRVPMEFRVKSKGRYSYLQACAEIFGGPNLLLRLSVNGEPGPAGDATVNLVVFGDTAGYYINDEDSLTVEPGDEISIVSVQAEPGACSGVIWSTGVNFAGSGTNDTIDVQCTEGWQFSGDVYEPSTRAEFWNFFDPLPDRVSGSAAEIARRTVWMASPFGGWEPALVPFDMPAAPGEDAFEYLALWQRIHEVEPTFEMEVRNLRVCMDVNTSGIPIRVGLMKSGSMPQRAGTFVECDEPGWYTNNVDRLAFDADDPSAHQVFRQGLALFFSPALTYEDEDGKGHNVTEAIAHVSQVQFSYGKHARDRECFHRVIPDSVPVDPLPAFTSFVRCIRVIREDGVVLGFTEHDEEVVFDGTTFKPGTGGFAGSATEMGAQFGDVGSMEASGFISDDGFGVDDLFGGRYDTARLEVWLVPWNAEDGLEARQIGGGVLGRTAVGDATFRIEALSTSAYLGKKSLLEQCTPSCRYRLGDSRCTVDLGAHTVTGMVTNLVDEDEPSSVALRRKFTDLGRTEASGTFTEGMLTWTSGANTGQVGKVKVQEGSALSLWEPMIHPISVGDEYSLVEGCDLKADTCREKFDNFVNFGGFPTVPGADAANETPSGKLGQ